MTSGSAQGCTFCRVIAGQTAVHVVLDDDLCLAFLDHRPLFPGHVLLVPKRHLETLADVPPNLLGPLLADVQRLSVAIPEAMGAAGTFVACNNRVSQSVPHLHVHVVPRRPKDGLRGFFWPRHRYEGEQAMADAASAIRDALNARQD